MQTDLLLADERRPCNPLPSPNLRLGPPPTLYHLSGTQCRNLLQRAPSHRNCLESPAHPVMPCRVVWGVRGWRYGSLIPTGSRRTGPTSWARITAQFFLKTGSSVPLSPKGRPYSASADCTCVLFDDLDAAQRFCETKVKELPSLICEIFNSEGRAKPPLLVITHPDYESDDDSGAASSRRRKLIVAALFAAGAALFSINFRGENTLATILASNCVLFGLRFLYWEFAVKHREQDRRRRLEAHRRVERGDA